MPTAVQPLKPEGPIASVEDRLAMLRLATLDQDRFVISTFEIDRGGVSYTVDTLRALRKERPDVEWFFLMGADSLNDLPKWREPEAIVRLAMPLVVHREGEAAPDFGILSDWVDADRLEEIRNQLVEMPPTPINSSDIREKIRNGDTSQEMPPEVLKYINRNAVYR